MGIRKSYGKNKKNKKPIGAITVKREETVRRAREVEGRYITTSAPVARLPGGGHRYEDSRDIVCH